MGCFLIVRKQDLSMNEFVECCKKDGLLKEEMGDD